MNNKIWLIIITFFLISIVLSGCQEQKASTTGYKFDNITLESDVVELVDASLEFKKDNDVIMRVNTKYLFRNIAKREITITINVEFYDKNNNLLSTEGPKHISLPKDYTETSILGANIISYSGEHASEVHHVKIIAVE